MYSFRLQNIKGFLDTGDINIKPITVIIGENSSGKSSIIRFPLVLRQTFLDASMAPLLFYGKTIDYGNYEDVIFSHDKMKSMSFDIVINGADLSKLRAYFYDEEFAKKLENELVKLKVTIVNCDRSLQVEKFSIHFGSSEEPFLVVKHIEKYNSYSMTLNNGQTTEIHKEDLPFDKFIPDFRYMHALKNNNKENMESMKRFEEISNFFYSFIYYFNALASKVFYIGPFRRTPERFYRYTENAVDYVGRDGEFAPVILGQDLRSNGRLVKEVSTWLENNLKFSLEVEDLRGDLFKIVIKDLKTNAKNNIIDVGHGLSQLIPIIIQTFMKNNINTNNISRRLSLPNLHIIEQPELHLHPAAQASLADLFVEAVNPKKGSSRNTFLIETHSEHMLLRLRRYIAEGRINPNDIALYYSEKNSKFGSLNVRQLEIDGDGNIKNWPNGFFSQDYNEAIALQKIINKRKGGESPVW